MHLAKLCTILSPALLLALTWGIFELLFQYQFGHAYTILLTYGLLYFLLHILITSSTVRGNSSPTHWGEVAIASVITVGIIKSAIARYGVQLIEPPILDIGYNTVDAARLFLLEGRNPYLPDPLFRWGDIPRFWGFHYGPFMFLGYFLSALIGGAAFKYTAIGFLGAIVIVACFLYRKIAPPDLSRPSGYSFIALTLMMGGFVWWDLAIGINDYLPVLLMLLGMLLLAYKQWFGCGIILGLAISAKFVPCVLLAALLVRKETPCKYYLGVLLGLCVMVPFLLWSPTDFINNVFIFHSVKPHNDSSIYSLTPKEFHFIYPILQLVICILFWMRNVGRNLVIHDLLFDFVRLTLWVNILFKETHRNHFWWTVPSLAILFALHRYEIMEKGIGSMKRFLLKAN